MWLSGREFKNIAFETGWSKSSIAEDIPHVLRAIIEGLDDEVQWPNEEQRHVLATQFDGIFSNCIGIIDGWECQINKSKNKEKATYSGKKKNNTKKVLAVIDYRGYFIFARTDIDGRYNDRTVFVESDLYLRRGEYVSPGRWLAADGIFEGDGSCGVS